MHFEGSLRVGVTEGSRGIKHACGCFAFESASPVVGMYTWK